jgi:tRNA splicing endonuclease
MVGERSIYVLLSGDPCMFHSRFVVVCSATEELDAWTDLVCRSRLGTAVKKTVLIAFLDAADQEVEFKALNRITKKRDKFQYGKHFKLLPD